LRHDLSALIRRMLRYGGVGLAISVLYSLTVIGAVNVLRPIGPTLASVLAFFVVLPFSWFAHGRISFGDRPRDPMQPWRFVFSTTATFAVAVGGMYWITQIAGQSYLLGIAWNWLIIPAMNFTTYLFWVFRTTRDRGSMA